MANSIISRNIIELSKSLQKNISYLDLSYKGPTLNLRNEKKITIRDGQPVLNLYKMWLQSKSTDYIRRPGFGGFFENNLNEYPFDESSIPLITQDLTRKTAQYFPNIHLISIDIECLKAARKWKVKVTVGDKSTGLVGMDLENHEDIEIETNSHSVD